MIVWLVVSIGSWSAAVCMTWVAVSVLRDAKRSQPYDDTSMLISFVLFGNASVCWLLLAQSLARLSEVLR